MRNRTGPGTLTHHSLLITRPRRPKLSLNPRAPGSVWACEMQGHAVAVASRSGPVILEEPTTRAAAFDSLLRAHKNRIYTYVCRLTNDSPDAEDLTQEVFIRAYQ